MMSSSGWEPSEGIILEREAENAIKSTRNQLVVAGPGTGKTEMLAQKADYLFQTGICADPFKILAISFKKDSATNLKKRVDKRSPQFSKYRFDSMTFDGFAKQILDQFRMGLPEDLRPNADYLVENTQLLDRMSRDSFTNRTPSKKEITSSWKNIQIQQNQLLERDRYLQNEMLTGTEDLPACLPYHAIMRLAQMILRLNPAVQQAVRNAYPFVFIDEFQDTTTSQLVLVRRLFENSGSAITAVGDDKQRIMIWAGARKTAFEDFCSIFAAETRELSINHRSAPAIVGLQRQMYASLNANSSTAIITEPSWNPDDGDIELLESDNEKEEAELLARRVKLLIDDGISPNKIAVLLKQKVSDYAPLLISSFASEGIKTRKEAEYQELLNESLVQLVIQTININLGKNTLAEWESYMSSFIVSRGIENEGAAYVKAERELNNYLKSTTTLLQKPANMQLVMKIIDQVTHFWTYDYLVGTDETYSNQERFSQLRETLATRLLEEYETTNNWIEVIDNFEGKHSVPIMTIHKSKGLQFEAVFIVALDDNAFWSMTKDADETRRAFFVAISRAKRYLGFTFSHHRHHGDIMTHNDIQEFYDLISSTAIRVNLANVKSELKSTD